MFVSFLKYLVKVLLGLPTRIVALSNMEALLTSAADWTESARELRAGCTYAGYGRRCRFLMLYASSVRAVLYVAICTQGEWEEHEWSKMADHVQVSKAL